MPRNQGGTLTREEKLELLLLLEKGLLGPDEKLEALQLLEEETRRMAARKMFQYYPDTGPLRRELYAKHMQFFEAGATYLERLFMAANRVGKTEGAGGLELTYHLTGQYPAWWKGRRFNRPIIAWAAGDTGKSVREIIQFKLLGPKHSLGSGLIPADCIARVTSKSGVADAIDTIQVKHVNGGISTLNLKSYDQKRIAFQGTELDVIWLDEEPPLDIYTECLLRTMTNKGMIMLTFTPLFGMSETVLAFLPGGTIQERADGQKFVVMATWDDVPHLDEAAKAQMLAAIPPFQRDARSKGVPQLGAGAIFPVPESDFVIDDFPIPPHFLHAYGMDVGWNRTAAPFGALDRATDILYLYSEHYRGQAEPSIHAQGIKSRGLWIPGVMDPAARGRSQRDGIQLMQDYKDMGLDVEVAFNGVEAGLYQVWQRLSTGRLKVFKSCVNWLQEFRLYRRDEKGNIVKVNDHLMDGTRYLVMSGLERAKVKPAGADKPESNIIYRGGSGGGQGWMG
jgi:phage terminase large subunit-like protein